MGFNQLFINKFKRKIAADAPPPAIPGATAPVQDTTAVPPAPGVNPAQGINPPVVQPKIKRAPKPPAAPKEPKVPAGPIQLTVQEFKSLHQAEIDRQKKALDSYFANNSQGAPSFTKDSAQRKQFIDTNIEPEINKVFTDVTTTGAAFRNEGKNPQGNKTPNAKNEWYQAIATSLNNHITNFLEQGYLPPFIKDAYTKIAQAELPKIAKENMKSDEATQQKSAQTLDDIGKQAQQIDVETPIFANGKLAGDSRGLYSQFRQQGMQKPDFHLFLTTNYKSRTEAQEKNNPQFDAMCKGINEADAVVSKSLNDIVGKTSYSVKGEGGVTISPRWLEDLLLGQFNGATIEFSGDIQSAKNMMHALMHINAIDAQESGNGFIIGSTNGAYMGRGSVRLDPLKASALQVLLENFDPSFIARSVLYHTTGPTKVGDEPKDKNKKQDITAGPKDELKKKDPNAFAKFIESIKKMFSKKEAPVATPATPAAPSNPPDAAAAVPFAPHESSFSKLLMIKLGASFGQKGIAEKANGAFRAIINGLSAIFAPSKVMAPFNNNVLIFNPGITGEKGSVTDDVRLLSSQNMKDNVTQYRAFDMSNTDHLAHLGEMGISEKKEQFVHFPIVITGLSMEEPGKVKNSQEYKEALNELNSKVLKVANKARAMGKEFNFELKEQVYPLTGPSPKDVDKVKKDKAFNPVDKSIFTNIMKYYETAVGQIDKMQDPRYTQNKADKNYELNEKKYKSIVTFVLDISFGSDTVSQMMSGGNKQEPGDAAGPAIHALSGKVQSTEINIDLQNVAKNFAMVRNSLIDTASNPQGEAEISKQDQGIFHKNIWLFDMAARAYDMMGNGNGIGRLSTRYESLADEASNFVKEIIVTGGDEDLKKIETSPIVKDFASKLSEAVAMEYYGVVKDTFRTKVDDKEFVSHLKDLVGDKVWSYIDVKVTKEKPVMENAQQSKNVSEAHKRYQDTFFEQFSRMKQSVLAGFFSKNFEVTKGELQKNPEHAKAIIGEFSRKCMSEYNKQATEAEQNFNKSNAAYELMAGIKSVGGITYLTSIMNSIMASLKMSLDNVANEPFALADMNALESKLKDTFLSYIKKEKLQEVVQTLRSPESLDKLKKDREDSGLTNAESRMTMLKWSMSAISSLSRKAAAESRIDSILVDYTKGNLPTMINNYVASFKAMMGSAEGDQLFRDIVETKIDVLLNDTFTKEISPIIDKEIAIQLKSIQDPSAINVGAVHKAIMDSKFNTEIYPPLHKVIVEYLGKDERPETGKFTKQRIDQLTKALQQSAFTSNTDVERSPYNESDKYFKQNPEPKMGPEAPEESNAMGRTTLEKPAGGEVTKFMGVLLSELKEMANDMILFKITEYVKGIANKTPVGFAMNATKKKGFYTKDNNFNIDAIRKNIDTDIIMQMMMLYPSKTKNKHEADFRLQYEALIEKEGKQERYAEMKSEFEKFKSLSTKRMYDFRRVPTTPEEMADRDKAMADSQVQEVAQAISRYKLTYVPSRTTRDYSSTYVSNLDLFNKEMLNKYYAYINTSKKVDINKKQFAQYLGVFDNVFALQALTLRKLDGLFNSLGTYITDDDVKNKFLALAANLKSSLIGLKKANKSIGNTYSAIRESIDLNENSAMDLANSLIAKFELFARIDRKIIAPLFEAITNFEVEYRRRIKKLFGERIDSYGSLNSALTDLFTMAKSGTTMLQDTRNVVSKGDEDSNVVRITNMFQKLHSVISQAIESMNRLLFTKNKSEIQKIYSGAVKEITNYIDPKSGTFKEDTAKALVIPTEYLKLLTKLEVSKTKQTE